MASTAMPASTRLAGVLQWPGVCFPGCRCHSGSAWYPMSDGRAWPPWAASGLAAGHVTVHAGAPGCPSLARMPPQRQFTRWGPRPAPRMCTARTAGRPLFLDLLRDQGSNRVARVGGHGAAASGSDQWLAPRRGHEGQGAARWLGSIRRCRLVIRRRLKRQPGSGAGIAGCPVAGWQRLPGFAFPAGAGPVPAGRRAAPRVPRMPPACFCKARTPPGSARAKVLTAVRVGCCRRCRQASAARCGAARC